MIKAFSSVFIYIFPMFLAELRFSCTLQKCVDSAICLETIYIICFLLDTGLIGLIRVSHNSCCKQSTL